MFQDRKFGVELEILAPMACSFQSVAEAIRSAGIHCMVESYGHSVPTTWKIVTDGSVNGPGLRGMEVVSPPLFGQAGVEQSRKVCEVLTALGCKVNKTCGFHVHVEARSLHIDHLKALVLSYAKAEPVIDQLMPPSRRAQSAYYCRSIAGVVEARVRASRTINELAAHIHSVSGATSARYVKLNLTAFWRHGTVEFRQHSGTVDADKVANWIALCLRMVDVATKPAAATGSAPLTNGDTEAMFVQLVSRDNGASRMEIARALGWTNGRGLAMNQMARRLGFTLDRSRVGREMRYFARFASQTEVAVVDVATLAAKLEMTETEQAFWSARAQALRSDLALAA